MFIAFEGPDNVGKSTSANRLDISGKATYNVTKAIHAEMQESAQAGTVICYDRIDWFTHMVYRLAYPHRDWNDDRPRTVFAMPDTHFVLKMHHPVMVDLIEDLGDGIEKGKLGAANEMYYYQTDFLMGLNRLKEYGLFKTMSIVEVSNDPRTGVFTQRLVAHESPLNVWTSGMAIHARVESDKDLLEFLHEQDRQLI